MTQQQNRWRKGVEHLLATSTSIRMTGVFICSKLQSMTCKELVKMEVPDLGMSMPVQRLYELVSQNLHVDPSDIELVAFGRILKPENNLAHYGVRSSSVVYVFKKRNVQHLIRRRDPSAPPAEPMTESEVHRIVVALRTALVNPDFKKIIDRLSEREQQENLMSVTPGLREDPVAMAILQDFELLNLCTERDNIELVHRKHPSLTTAATFLAAEFHEQHTSADIFRRSPRLSYSIDDHDDDEDDEEGEAAYNFAAQAAAAAAARSAARNTASSNPNQDHQNLAQLLREALANANAMGPASDPGASTSRAGQTVAAGSGAASQQQVPAAGNSNLLIGSDASSEPPARITPEMLQLALNSIQPADASAPSSASSAPVSNVVPAAAAATQAPAGNQRRDWSRELRQMRDMGITDEAICIQALEAVNGDVQMALNIIFNQ